MDFNVRLLLDRSKEMPGAQVPAHDMSGGWTGSRMEWSEVVSR